MKLALRRWLAAPGSLSRRLASAGRFQVQSVSQGPGRLLPGEARELKLRAGRHWVREVVLRVDGEAVVWARSITPCRGLAGPWRALRALGARPLAQLLFDDRGVRRSPLRGHAHRRGGCWHRRACRAWRAAGRGAWPGAVMWGRSSVFSRRGASLHLFEAFAPGVCALPRRCTARRCPAGNPASATPGPLPRPRIPRNRASGSAERP